MAEDPVILLSPCKESYSNIEDEESYQNSQNQDSYSSSNPFRNNARDQIVYQNENEKDLGNIIIHDKSRDHKENEVTDLKWPKIEEWLDAHQEQLEEYVIKKGKLKLINKWLTSHGYLTVTPHTQFRAAGYKSSGNTASQKNLPPPNR